MKLKKGDNVKIMAGKDRGKTGAILYVSPTDLKITVEGVNLFKKRSRPKKQGETGQTVMVSRPFPASRVELICSSCKSPTRIGYRMDGAAKVRYCKKCKATI